MGDSAATPEDIVLIARVCTRMSGPLGFKGRLELTDRELRYTPTARLGKLVGAKEWRIDLADIISTQLAGVRRVFCVETKEDIERFTGDGARQVYERLASLQRHLRGETTEEEAYAQSERVLVQGTVNRYVSSVVAVPGQIELTDRRLRFTARGFEKRFWSEADFETPLKAITNAERSGAQMKLALTINDEVVELGGGVSPTIYARLVAQRGVSLAGEVGQIVDSFKGSLCSGPVMTEVELIVSTRRVVLAVLGTLDGVAGFRDQIIELHDVSSLTIQGWPQPRLRIGVLGTDPFEISLKNVDDQFRQFVDLVASYAHLDVVPADDMAETAAELLALSQLELRQEEHVNTLTPVLGWESSAEVVRSWLILTSERAIVLPWDERDAASNAVAYNFDQLARDDLGDEEHGPSVHLSIDGEPYVMTLVDPELDPEEIYNLLDLPPPPPSSTRASSIQDGEPTPLPQHLMPDEGPLPPSRPTAPPPPSPLPPPAHETGPKELQGKAIFLRLIGSSGKVVTLRRRARLKLSADSNRYFVTGARPDALSVGEKVKVALGRPEGLYAFASKVLEPGDSKGDACLTLAVPRRIRSFDRRRFFRQSMNTTTTVRLMSKDGDGNWTAGAETLEVELVDVSRGGIAIRSRTTLSQGDHVTWMMSDAKTLQAVEATCVRAQKIVRRKKSRDAQEAAEDETTLWQYGLEFAEPTDALTIAIDALIETRVRQRWFERGVREPKGFQTVFECVVDGWTCTVDVDPADPKARVNVSPPDESRADKSVDISLATSSCPVAELKSKILQSGLRFSPSETIAVEGALRTLSSNPTIGPIQIAKGIEPIEGHSGQVHWMVAVEGVDRLSINGFIDLHEVEVFVNVMAEDVICAFTEPHCGMAGRDVYGDPIPPPALPPIPLKLGDGVRFDEDSRRVVSVGGGCVNYDGSNLSVVQVYTVKGDVDFKVGNIHFDGNVVVTGNVIEGFKVTAAGDVDIGGIVDAATIVAGGSIRVGGGVTGHNRAILRAGGEIRARYLNGVDVQAGRQLTIERQIRNCQVMAGSGIVVQRGGIVGGSVRSAGPIQTVSLGSVRYVQTHISAGAGLIPTPHFGKVDREIGLLQTQISRLEKDIGHLIENPEYIDRLNDQQRTIFEQREKKLTEAREKLDELETVLTESSVAANDRVTILVMREAFPNCTIQIARNYQTQLDQPLTGEHSFAVDEETGVIVPHRR